MIYRFLSYGFFLLGLFLLGLAGYFYFAPEPGPSLNISQQDLEVSDCVPGRKTAVNFQIHNASSRPIRILGLSQC